MVNGAVRIAGDQTRVTLRLANKGRLATQEDTSANGTLSATDRDRNRLWQGTGLTTGIPLSWDTRLMISREVQSDFPARGLWSARQMSAVWSGAKA